jgi:hypothetical protein
VRLARVNGLGSGDVHLVPLPTDRVALVLGYGRAAGTIVANYDDVFGNRWTTRLPLGPDPDGASVRPGRAAIARR